VSTPRVQRRPPASKQDDIADDDTSGRPQRSTNPRQHLPHSAQREESASTNGSAQIWPSSTVSVRRLDKERSPEKFVTWDLAVDFDLADFASDERKEVPEIIENHLAKATQQYQNDLSEKEKQIEEMEEDNNQFDTERLRRTYSFDGSREMSNLNVAPLENVAVV